MKNKALVYIALVIAALASACEKFEDETVDFSERYPAYVRLPTRTGPVDTLREGRTATFRVDISPIVYRDVTVDYTITGGLNATGQVVIPSGSPNASFTVPVPSNNVAEANRPAVLKLTGATEGIAVGRLGRNTERNLIIRDQ